MEFIYFERTDAIAEKQAAQMLPEGRTYNVDNKWSVRADKPHTTGMQNHNHIQLRGTEIAVINYDKTPSHNSDLSSVPNWLFGWMKNKGLTESYRQNMPEIVPASAIDEAVRHETLMQQSIDHITQTSPR